MPIVECSPQVVARHAGVSWRQTAQGQVRRHSLREHGQPLADGFLSHATLQGAYIEYR